MADGRLVIDTILNREGAERGMQELQQSMSRIGDQMKSTGESLSKYLTVPLLAIGTASVASAVSVNNAQTKIQNSLGVTANKAKELTSIARDIYKDGFGESLEEVSDALVRTRQNIKNLDDEELGKVTKGALNLAKTFDSDVNEVTRAGNNIMKGFGIESDKAFDLMAFGAQKGLNFSNEMFDNLSEYAPLFAKMGYSADEYFQLLINGSEAGVYNLDYINDAMKEFQIRIKDGSKSTSQAMGELSSSTQKVWKDFLNGKGTVKDVSNAVLGELKGMDDQVEANNIGVALFGTKWEDLEADAMYALGGIDGKLGEVAGSMDKMNKVAEESFGQKFTSIIREMAGALEPLGRIILDLASNALPLMKKVINAVTKAFEGMPTPVQYAIVIIGGLVMALGPLLMAVSSMIPAFVALAGGLNMSAGALLGIVAKVVAVSGIFAVLGVAVYLIIDHFDYLKEKATEVGSSLLSTMKPALDTIRSLLEGVASVLTGDLKKGTQIIEEILPKPVATFIVKGLDMIREGFLNVKQAIEDAFNGDFSAISEYIPKIIGILTGGIPSLIITGLQFLPALAEGIQANLPMILETAQTIIQTIVDNFVMNLPVFLQAGIDIVTNLLQGFTQSLPVIIEAVVSLLNTIIEQITIYLPMIIGAGVLILTNLINGIVQALPQIITAVTQAITVLTQTITEMLPIIIQAGITILMAVIDGLIQSLPLIIEACLTIILAIADALIQNLPTIISAGIKILQSLIDGVISMLPQLIEMALYLIISVAQALIDNLPKIIDAGIELLLALVDGIIKMLPELIEAAVTIIIKLTEGLIQHMPELIEAGGKLLMALIEGLFSLSGELIGVGLDLIGELAGAFLSGVGDIFGVGADIVNGLTDGMNSMLGSILDTASDIGNSIKNTFKDIFNIHSPSRWMRDDIGVNLMKGYMVGVDQEKQSVLRKSAETADWMKPDLSIMDFMPDVSPSMTASGYTNSVTNNNNTPVTINMEYYGDGSQQDANNFVDMIDKAFGERLTQNNFMIGVRGNA
ncbi:phage tail tape measure protein [Bacillus sonorensis]|uniref:phage tail tape measure protein n=1 Tax=Bacillus sonorensis TaxID=119858 RepID=UPI00098B60C5|nr:phage tail tape measure protein [Bacillus sonorensis]